MPDQSAINKKATLKRIVPRKYNEQKKMRKNTVFHHFTTRLRFFPWFHTITIKPWEIEKVHKKFKIFEYDDIMHIYTEEIKGIKFE